MDGCMYVRMYFVSFCICWALTLTAHQFTAVHNTVSRRNTKFRNQKTPCRIELRHNDTTQTGMQNGNLCWYRVNSKDMLWRHILRRSWQWSLLIICIHGGWQTGEDKQHRHTNIYKHLVLLICLIVISSEGGKRTLWANILQKPPTLKLKYTDYSTFHLKTPIPVENIFQKKKKHMGGLNYLFTEPFHNLLIKWKQHF